MRLLYRWFCRVIGLGSALDVMNLYVVMLIWILGVFIIFLPEDVNSKKHRSPHRHGHHRHHHHYHRKHSKNRHQLSSNENFSFNTTKRSDYSSKNFNITNIVNTTPWIINQTSTSLFFNSNFVDKEEIVTLYRNINLENGTSIPNLDETLNDFINSTSIMNHTQQNINSSYNPIDTKNLITINNYKNSSNMDFSTILIDSQITITAIEETTVKIVSQSLTNFSRVEEAEKIKIDENMNLVSSNTFFNKTEVEQEPVMEKHWKLFDTAEDRKYLTDAAIETPVVELIRKKRSAVVEQEEAVDEKTRKATLLDFNGPAISNDPEEMRDRESSNALHVRVKRDGSELDNDRSSLFFDSAYLRNLEDSFALSALEVQAQGSQVSDRIQRETGHRENNLESSSNITRSKRDTEQNIEEVNNDLFQPIKLSLTAEDNNNISRNRGNEFEHLTNNQSSLNSDEEDNGNEFAVGSRWTTLADSIAKSINSTLSNRIDNVQDQTDDPSPVDLDEEKKTNDFQAGSQTSIPADFLTNKINTLDLEIKSTNDFVAESMTSTPVNIFVNNVNSVSENRVYTMEYPVDSASTFNPYQEDYTNNSAINSRTLSTVVSFFKNASSVSVNRVNDVESDRDNSSPDKNDREANQDDGVNKDRSSIKHSQRSPSDNYILKDGNSILRYRLDDVYPEIIQDSENLSSMVELVRTKRFGDSIVYPEAPDVSYANEIDNSRILDEPYAEDNRIIDSMLSKVDYRSVDEEDRSGRSENAKLFNEEEIDGDRRREDGAMRGKRGTLPKRTRKKIVGSRRGYRKKKKHRKGKAKKHRSKPSKIKRTSRDLSEREFDIENFLSDAKRQDVENQLNDNGEEVISPHDGRRRRESEDEDDENFYLDENENAERVREVRSISEADFKRESISPNATGIGKVTMESKSRDKRKSALREMKYVKNIREADVEQNRSKEITDKHLLKAEAAGPIRDIRQLVAELLAKVDELHGYITEGSEDETSKNSPQVTGMLSNTSNVVRAIEVPLKILRQTTNSQSTENAVPKLSNDMKKHPEACWKHPTSWNRKTQPSKNNRPARNLRGQRCGKNLRRKRKSHRKWDRWTDWSSCSVTCGRGRQIRWRHCVRNCSTAETEMEEKACQLPACAPGKFLGIFG